MHAVVLQSGALGLERSTSWLFVLAREELPPRLFELVLRHTSAVAEVNCAVAELISWGRCVPVNAVVWRYRKHYGTRLVAVGDYSEGVG